MSSRWAYNAFKCDGYDRCPGDCDLVCAVKDEELEDTMLRKVDAEMDRIRLKKAEDRYDLAFLVGRLHGLGYARLMLKEAINGEGRD